jgi:GMP synthase-like glutamine amidotransferase
MTDRRLHSRLRALVIQHERDIPGGHVDEWLDERGIERDVLRIEAGERAVDVAAYDLVVCLGSWHGAYEDFAWIRREEALLRDAHEREVPILAICFGSQLLAKALGGEAFRRREPEVSWLKVRTRDESVVPEGPWLVWHFDSFTLPPGATLLAETPAAPQAYAIGRSLGIQFHAEVTVETIASWLRKCSSELEQSGVDTPRLLAESHERAAGARASAMRLFDAFLEANTADAAFSAITR